MTDREQIEYLKFQIRMFNYHITRANNKQRINYLNKVHAVDINNLIIVLIRLINDKHCS